MLGEKLQFTNARSRNSGPCLQGRASLRWPARLAYRAHHEDRHDHRLLRLAPAPAPATPMMDDELVARYLEYQRVERRLAENTLTAYQLNLAMLAPTPI